MTLEGQIVRIADIVAYVNHDLDDAVRAGLLADGELPEIVTRELGRTHCERIDALVRDLVESSRFEEKRMIRMTRRDAAGALSRCATSSTRRSTSRRTCATSSSKAQRILEELWSYFHEHADEFRASTGPRATRQDESLDRAIADFICGMTDRYAMRLYQEKRLPRPWTVY